MKQIYKNVKMDIVTLEQLDVITASTGDTYFENELPLVPFSTDNFA